MTFRGGIDPMNISNIKLKPQGVFGMSSFKKRIIACVAALLIVAGTLGYLYQEGKPLTWEEALEQYIGPSEYKKVDPDKPLHLQTSIFEIAGRTFEMPTVYIQGNLGGKRVLPDGINLIYVLPGFTHQADFKDREEYEAARKEQRMAHMLVETEVSRHSLPEATKNPLNDMVRNRRNMLPKEESCGFHNGLECYKWYQKELDKLVLQREVYLEKDNEGKIVNFIECWTVETGATIPGCSHRFTDKHLLYKIYYSKEKYFSQWRQQRTSAIKFIDSFEIKPKIQRPKEQ
jgi:hypothetical protein